MFGFCFVQYLIANLKQKDKIKTMNRTKKSRIFRKPVGVALIIIALLALVVGAWAWHSSDKPLATSGTIPSTSTNETKNNKNDSGNSSSPNIEDKTPSTDKNPGSSTSSGSSGKLTVSPSGTFVSNHKPNLSGAPSPSEEQSVCNTVPGANCYIKFVMGGVVKKLDTRIADSSGSVIWSWDVKQAGFTEGKWTITAVTTLNGQTKTTTDSLALEIQP